VQNTNIKILLLGSSFLLSLAPIGIETTIFWNNLESLKDFFNFFRLVIPVVIFIILSLFFIKQLQIKILFNNFFIIFYFVIIFITTLINLENFKEIDKLLLPLYCINYIFLALLVLNINDIKKEFNKFIFLQFLIITVLTTFALFNFFFSFVNLNLSDLYNLKIENNFYNQNSNGVSRILLIISLYILLVNKKNQYLYISCILVNTLIILLQSKLVLFFLLLFFLGKMFFEKNLIKEKIKEIFFVLFIPVLITFFISSINTTQADSGLRIAQEIKKDIKTIYKPFDSNIFAGLKVRIETWKEITNNSSKPVIGYGSQADRYLAKNLPSHAQLAANSFIYAYACAGLLGVVAIIIIYFNIIKLIIKRILATNLKNKINNVQIFYIVVLFFLIIRSIVENSFAVWGIDFILMINCYLGLKNPPTKLNNKKYLFK
jgi:hypothetical protein